MNAHDIKNAFPPMPEACREALLAAAGSVKEERTMKKALRFATLAAALMLALTSVAYAVTRPQVLDWLLGSNPAGPWLDKAAQTVEASASADGVNVSVTSLIYDGQQLVLSYEASVDDPTRAALIALDESITLNGQNAQLDVSPMIDCRLVPSTRLDILPVQRNPILAGAWCPSLPELSGAVDAEVTFLILRPEKAFAIIDDGVLTDDLSGMDAETRAEYQDCRDAILALTNAVIVDGDPEAYATDGYTLIERSGMLAEDEDAHLTETRLTVLFRFNADAPTVYDFSDAADATLPDATLHVEAFRLSPLSTTVRAHLIPPENTEEAARRLCEAYGEATLTDEKGHEVTYADMDYLSGSTPYATQVDGQWVCRYLIDMPGLLVIPGSIGLTTPAGDLLRFPLEP